MVFEVEVFTLSFRVFVCGTIKYKLATQTEPSAMRRGCGSKFEQNAQSQFHSALGILFFFVWIFRDTVFYCKAINVFLKTGVSTTGDRMADIPSHHFIYGTCSDYITGKAIVDTDDERYRQKLARLFVEEKGFQKTDLEPRVKIETLFSSNFVVSTIDLIVSLEQKRLFVVRYGPGSLVTRERPALAAARVIDQGYIVPYSIVTNGEDAELLDSSSGLVLATGMECIPDRDAALHLLTEAPFVPLPEGQREKELRILNAFDKEVCCVGGPCALPSAPEG